MRRLALLIALISPYSFFAAASAFAQPDEALHYRLPKGWIDLVDPDAETAGLPVNLVQQARSGRYMIYAYDPASLTRQGANTFNVVEMRAQGAVTEAVMRKTADGASKQARDMGLEMRFLETKVVKLAGVDVGRSVSLMTAGGVTVKLLQYLVTGKTMAATLTYACAPADFDRYVPVFEESAMATTGAYQHPRGIDLARVLKTGAIGGVLGLIGSLAFAAAKKRKPVPATAAAPAAAARSAALWDCPTCKRRVPNRIEQCRCGTPRPAM